MPKILTASPEHEVTYQELAALLQRRAAKGISAEEILAVGANMLGKLIALQDQRTMTRERALKTILHNIELGNSQAIDKVLNPKGSA